MHHRFNLTKLIKLFDGFLSYCIGSDPLLSSGWFQMASRDLTVASGDQGERGNGESIQRRHHGTSRSSKVSSAGSSWEGPGIKRSIVSFTIK